MGRPKLDTYWYVFAIGSAALATVGLVKLATYREPRVSDPDYYGRHVDQYDPYMWLFFAVLAGITAAQLWAKKVSRLKVPKELRKK